MHSGGIHGFGSELIMDNENKIGIIVLSNTDGSPIYLNQDKSITKNLYEIVGKAIINSNINNKSLKWEEYENIYTNNYFHHYYITELDQELVLINLRDNFPLKNPTILQFSGKDLFLDPKNSGFYSGEFFIQFERNKLNKINSLILANEKLYIKN